MANYCNECGLENSDADKFCISCGSPLSPPSSDSGDRSTYSSDFTSDGGQTPYKPYSPSAPPPPPIEEKPYSSSTSPYSSGNTYSDEKAYSSDYPSKYSPAKRERSVYQSSSYSHNIPNHLAPAILSTLFCCIPLGVISIVYAAQVNEKLKREDYEGAISASDNAKKWAYIAFFAGVATQTIPFILQIFAQIFR